MVEKDTLFSDLLRSELNSRKHTHSVWLTPPPGAILKWITMSYYLQDILETKYSPLLAKLLWGVYLNYRVSAGDRIGPVFVSVHHFTVWPITWQHKMKISWVKGIWNVWTLGRFLCLSLPGFPVRSYSEASVMAVWGLPSAACQFLFFFQIGPLLRELSSKM